MTIHPMNVFPWIFAEINDAKRVYQKFVKYLIKGKQIQISKIENINNVNNDQTNFSYKDTLQNDSNDSFMDNNIQENTLLNISDVKIKYNNVNSKKKKDTDIKIDSSIVNFGLEIDKNNTLSVEKNEIVIVYGNNGSGKSLLLKSILNYSHENEKSENDISTHSEILISNLKKNKISPKENFYIRKNNISYVSQELWTFSASIFENITFDRINHLKSNYLHGRFKEILDKCEMIKDIESFPEMEKTLINFKGSNISGGQKQRINIARAAFNKDSDLVLLDNCLSSIDSNLANLISKNLFQFLKSEGKGILFVTSDMKWLKYADKIYFIENKSLIKKDRSKINIHNNSFDSINKCNQKNIDFVNPKGEENEINKTKNISDKNNNISITSNTEKNKNIFISYKTLVFFFSKAGYVMFLTTILFLIFMQLGKNFIELYLAEWLKSSKDDLDMKFKIQISNMKYYVLFVILHSVATVGRSAFFAINFLKGAEKIYKITIEKFIFSKIKSIQQFNIGYLTNLYIIELFLCLLIFFLYIK